jgi:hypothetical protein
MTIRYVLAAVLCSACAFAQEASRAGTPYTVQFTIRDANDAAAKSGRTYITQADSANARSTIRTGTKVPYQTSAGQFSYADIGVNIDTRLNERDGRLNLWAAIELSSLVERAPTPVIAQVRAETSTVVTAGKEVPVLTIDDPILQRKLRVDALVTAQK